MTTSTLIQRTRDILRDVSSIYGEDYDDASVAASLNDALQELGRLTYIVDVRVPITLTAGTSVYDMRSSSVVARQVIEPLEVSINKKRLMRADNRSFGLWSPWELDRNCPTWPDDASGTPIRAAFSGDRKLILHPSPTQAIVDAGNNYLVAQVLPAALPTDGLSDPAPEIDDIMHDDLAKLAAYKMAWRPTQISQAQMAILQSLRSDAIETAKELGNENRRAHSAPGSTYFGSAVRRSIRI